MDTHTSEPYTRVTKTCVRINTNTQDIPLTQVFSLTQVFPPEKKVTANYITKCLDQLSEDGKPYE